METCVGEFMSSEALPPRESNLSETTENYLKRIYILIQAEGKARTSDIARLMGRSLSSVSEAVKRMAEEGYLNYEKYGKITLTEEGNRIAESVHNNYSVIHDLLQTLGLPQKIAMEDACSMEHSVSKVTIDTISKFVDFVDSNKDAQDILDQFISR